MMIVQKFKELQEEIELIEKVLLLDFFNITQEDDPSEGMENFVNFLDDEENYKKYVICLRSYVLLCHAAIEGFLEEMSVFYLKESIKKFRDDGKVNLICINVVKNSNRKLTSDFLTDYLNDHCIMISKNHGIKEENVSNLLSPLGIEDIDFSLLTDLGKLRGSLAHDNNYKSQSSIGLAKGKGANANPQNYKDKVVSVLKVINVDILPMMRQLYTDNLI